MASASRPSTAAARASSRSGVSRCLEVPRGGARSRISTPAMTVPAGRLAEHRPIARERGDRRVERRQAQPVHRADPAQLRPAWAVPMWRRRLEAAPAPPRRAGPPTWPDGRSRTSTRSVPWTSPARACPPARTSPRRSAGATAPVMLNATRPPWWTSRVMPWTWTSRTRTDRSRRTAPGNVTPRSTARPRSVPVTTAPRPLTAKTRSIASARPAAVAARRRATGRHPVAERSTLPTAQPSIPSPVAAEAAMTGEPASDVAVEQPPTSHDLGRVPLGAGDVGLGDDREPVRRSRARRAARGARASGRAGRRRRRRRAARRRSRRPRRACCRRAGRGPARPRSRARAVGQREVRVADVDRHPPPPLLGQPVGVDAGQRAQERRLAVVDVAGRADDDGHRPVSPRRAPRAIARGEASSSGRVRPSAGRARPGRPRSGR